MGTKLTYLGILLMVVVLLSFSLPYVWSAEGQRATQAMIRDLEKEGKNNCEVWNINDFFYLPIRMNFSFEKTLSVDPDISSRGADSEGIFFEGTSETFQIVTNTAGIHTVGFVLDYEDKHRDPRQVYWQIFSQDRTLMMEGNWVHEGFTFCKYVVFTATTAPHILTPEEIQEANNKFNSDFRKEVATYNTTVENSLLGIVMMIIIAGIVFVGFMFFIMMAIRSLGKVADKPVKKLDDMIVIYRKMIENLKLVTADMISSKGSMIYNLTNMVNAIINDLPKVIAGKKHTIEVSDSLLEPKILMYPEDPTEKKLREEKENTELSHAILTEDELKEIIENDEKIKEESYKAGLGVEHQEPEVELPPEPESTGLSFQEKSEEKEDETELRNETEETVQVDADSKCSMCKKSPEIICTKCEELFCNKHHEKHKCQGKKKPEEKKEKGIVGKITDQVKKPTEMITSKLSKKDEEKPYDDEFIHNWLVQNKEPKQLESLMVEAYMKIPEDEARTLYEDLQKDYKKKASVIKQLRLNALLIRILRSQT